MAGTSGDSQGWGSLRFEFWFFIGIMGFMACFLTTYVVFPRIFSTVWLGMLSAVKIGLNIVFTKDVFRLLFWGVFGFLGFGLSIIVAGWVKMIFHTLSRNSETKQDEWNEYRIK